MPFSYDVSFWPSCTKVTRFQVSVVRGGVWRPTLADDFELGDVLREEDRDRRLETRRVEGELRMAGIVDEVSVTGSVLLCRS